MNSVQTVTLIAFFVTSVILLLGLAVFEKVLLPKRNSIDERLGGTRQSIHSNYVSSKTVFGRFYNNNLRKYIHKDEESFNELAGKLKIDTNSLQAKINEAQMKDKITVEEVVAYKILGYIGMVIFLLLWAVSSSFILLALSLVSFFLGGFLPERTINTVVNKKRNEIRNGLPEYIDLLKVVVESGLPIEEAINHITDRTTGALADEFLITMADTKVLGSWDKAMSNMIERNDIEELSDLLSALMISVSKGTSVSDTLEDESRKLRELYSASFDEKAKKVTIKMLPVMLLFLFGPFFILLLAPVMMNMINSF